MKRFFIYLVALIFVVSIVACGSKSSGKTDEAKASKPAETKSGQQEAGKVNFSFAIGQTGGSIYPFNLAVVNMIEQKVPGIGKITTTPGGGAANLLAVAEKKVQMGTVFSTDLFNAIQGQQPYNKKITNVSPLFTAHPFKASLIVPKNSKIQSYKDLKGKKVNIGPNGSSITVTVLRLLELYGYKPGDINYSNLSITDSVEQFKDGHLDALYYHTSDYFGAYLDLAQSKEIRVIPIDQDILKKMIDENPGYFLAKWPLTSDIYKGLQPTDTLALTNVAIVDPDVFSEEMAYNIVKTLAENWPAIKKIEKSLELLEPKDLASNTGSVPFHPGAQKYFKEKGWIK